MQIVETTIDAIQINYPLEHIAPLSQILFLDIETTGFTARSSILYLIGTAYYQDNSWHTKQFFAESESDEADVLHSFFEFAKKFTHIIHFNGNNFDLPFILQKVQAFHLDYSLDAFIGIDLYRRISRYKTVLNLPNCKQKTIEHYLGIFREDQYSGGDLISVYHDYCKAPEDSKRSLLLLHNSEDLQGMLRILPILSIHDVFNEAHRPKKVQSNSYLDFTGDRKLELYIKFKLCTQLPKPISYSQNNCYFTATENEGTLRIPIYEEEMKFFYTNYKEYYYLPDEDIALHKSIAGFVDKNYRLQATAQTCYTRKYSIYLPQWSDTFHPLFKRSYQSADLFFELTDEMKTNRDFFVTYIQHTLQMLVS